MNLTRSPRMARRWKTSAAIWRLTPGEGWIAALTANRLTAPLSRFACDRFADALYASNRRKGRR